VAVVGPGWIKIGDIRRDWDLRNAWHAIRVLETVPLGHPNSAPQMWFLGEQLAELGLYVQPENPRASEKTQRASIERQLIERGSAFLAPALAEGWELTGPGLGARTTLTRRVGHELRSLSIVLEPYQWLHDRRGDAVAGSADTALADDPETRADQIIRRTETINELLKVLPMSTPAGTAHKLMDVLQLSKRSQERRGVKAVDAAGRQRLRIITEQGVVPPLDSRAGLKGEVMPALGWWREAADHEVAAATWVVQLDQRWSYPAQCNELWLGYGTPTQVDAPEALALAEKLARGDDPDHTFALWRCDPARDWRQLWGDGRMFPPHQDLQNPDNATWVLPPTMQLLLTDRDHHGCGLHLEELGITGAWVWPDSGRMLEPMYRATQRAWAHIGQLADRDADLKDWLTRFIKGMGRGGLGYVASKYAEQEKRKPWRYQPIWWEAIKAASAAKLWRQMSTLTELYKIWPLQVATDAVICLVDDDTLQRLEDYDDGTRLGVLKIDKVALLELAPETGQELVALAGRRPQQVITWHSDEENS
jgi:hypothetical protein